MSVMGGAELGRVMLAAVKDFVGRSLSPVLAGVAELERKMVALTAEREAIAQLVAQEVAKAVAAMPVPRDGLDGEKGDRGRDGRDGTDGRDGKDATDGRNGTDGKDGRDALNVEAFAAELHEDGRTVIFNLSSGGKEYRSQVVLAVPIDRGVYKAGQEYHRGDVVSWDGSGWIAQQTTSDKPGASEGWRLAIKRGRDGKDAKVVETPLPREPVRLR